MNNDTKPDAPLAKRAENTKPSQDFNLENAFAEYIPKLSEDGLQRFKIIAENSTQLLEKEAKDQKFKHQFRVQREEIKLLKDYITNPAPRPEGQMIDHANDLKIIAEQAEQNVQHKELQFLENLKRNSQKNLENIIATDLKEQQKQIENPNHQHSHEQER